MGGGNNPSGGSGLRFVANAFPLPTGTENVAASPDNWAITDPSLTGATLALVEFAVTPGNSQFAEANVQDTTILRGDSNQAGIATAWSKFDTVDGNRYNFINFVTALVPVTGGSVLLTNLNATAGGNFGSVTWRIIGVFK